MAIEAGSPVKVAMGTLIEAFQDNSFDGSHLLLSIIESLAPAENAGTGLEYATVTLEVDSSSTLTVLARVTADANKVVVATDLGEISFRTWLEALPMPYGPNLRRYADDQSRYEALNSYQSSWWLRTKKKFRILDLPREIRDIIYQHAIEPVIRPYMPLKRRTIPRPSSMLKTLSLVGSVQLHREAREHAVKHCWWTFMSLRSFRQFVCGFYKKASFIEICLHKVRYIQLAFDDLEDWTLLLDLAALSVLDPKAQILDAVHGRLEHFHNLRRIDLCLPSTRDYPVVVGDILGGDAQRLLEDQAEHPERVFPMELLRECTVTLSSQPSFLSSLWIPGTAIADDTRALKD